MQEQVYDLTHTWVGIVDLLIFMIAYFYIITQDRYAINRSKPSLFAGTFMFVLIGIYFSLNGFDYKILDERLESLILETAEIFFFLLVAMTFIETLLERRVFDVLKYRLLSKGYSYKKLFWLTGLLAFIISPIAYNLTTALFLATIIFSIDKKNLAFLVPASVNIVVSVNAGGAWSPFGDITTLMSWSAEKGSFIDFLYLFPALFFGWLVTSYLLSLFIPDGEPCFNSKTKRPTIKDGGRAVIYIGIFTVAISILGHKYFDFPAMWGMMFGLALLKLFSYILKKRGKNSFNIYANMQKIENDTLLYFFGLFAIIGALQFLGFLEYIHHIYDLMGTTFSNIGIGLLSGVLDNVLVMGSVIKASPNMDTAQWVLVTMTIGIGGSLLSFGSAAGVGVMGKLRGKYTIKSHIKYIWTILAGYIVSIIIWYIQFEIFGIY